MNDSDALADADVLLDRDVFESAARYFSVLGEPARLRILHAVCQEELCVNDIIRATGLAQANVSRHLGLMYQSRVLDRRRQGTQIFYRVADRLIVELCRSVSAQLLNRLSGTGVPPPLPLGELPDLPFPPLQKKEQESV